MRGEGADTRLRGNIGIEDRRRTVEYWNGLRFIRSKAKSEMLEKTGGEGAGRSGRMKVRGAVGGWDVRKRTMGKMDSKLGNGVRGCRGKVKGGRRETRSFVNELAGGDP